MDFVDIKKQNIGKAISVTLPPKITYPVALAGVAEYYFGKGIAPIIGAGIGYLLGSKVYVDPEKKKEQIQQILADRQFIIDQLNSQVENEKLSGIMSSSELLNYKYKQIPFSGKWEEFIGQPSTNFHAMIYGRPKQGKSILAVQFAKYLSEQYGTVLYIASEEGFSVTLQKKISDFAMGNQNLDFANYRDFNQIKSALKSRKYNFVFIDSVNFIKITPEDVEDLKSSNRETAFITIQQATKDGKFRGSQEFAHNCDIIIKVEAGKAAQQGRFHEPSEMDIFESPEVVDEKKQGKKTKKSLDPEIQPAQIDLFSIQESSESNF